MNQKKKEYIINNLKWPINHFDYCSHYFILIFPLLLICTGISEINEDEFAPNLIITGIVALLYIIYRIESERKFTPLTFKKDLSTIEIGKLLAKNGWFITNQYDGTVQFRTSNSSFDSKQTVTIIRATKEKILINTQPGGRAMFTFFKDKLNYNQVKRILNN